MSRHYANDLGSHGMSTETSALQTQESLAFLWLEITSKCNLTCDHCYADSGPKKDLRGRMTTDKWLEVIRDAAQLGCKQVQFIGGEPTLHPDLPQLISAASEHGFGFIEVYTNATGVSEALLEVFIAHRVRVAFSFYSSDPQVHDSITGRKGSFQKTVRTVRQLVARGLDLRAGVIETGKNFGQGCAAQAFLKTLGVSETRLDFSRPVGRGATKSSSASAFDALCGECRHGRLCVSASGDVYPCVFSRAWVLGNIEHGLKSISAGRALSEFRRELHSHMKLREATANESDTVIDAAGHRCPPTCSPGMPFKCMPSSEPSPSRCTPTGEPKGLVTWSPRQVRIS